MFSKDDDKPYLPRYAAMNMTQTPVGHWCRYDDARRYAEERIAQALGMTDQKIWDAVYAFNAISRLHGDAQNHFDAMKAAMTTLLRDKPA